MTNQLSLALGVSLALSLLVGTAQADTLILKEKDGTSARIEGKLIERRENEFVFEHTLGGARIRSTFARADVVSVLVDVVNAPLPSTKTAPSAPPTRTREPGQRRPAEARKSSSSIPEEFPELGPNVRNVIVVLDRSSAMLAGERWKTALGIVDSIVDHLPPKATFGVYIYDEDAYSVLGTNYISKTEPKRHKLRPTLERLGVNPWDRGNIRAGLQAAYNARPDAVYLVSAGVVAESQDETAAFVRLMAQLHPRPKKFPVHVVSVLGGKTQDADDGTETRRMVLDAIAQGLDGVYREVLLDTVAGTTRSRRGGGKPPSSSSSKKTTGPTTGGSGRGGMDHMDAATIAAFRARMQAGGGPGMGGPGMTGPSSSGMGNSGGMGGNGGGSTTTIITGQ